MNIPADKIGFDFDGVIADTGETFVRIACEQYDYCSFTLEDITTFEVEGCIDMPSHLMQKIFQDILEDSLATGLKPLPGAKEVLSELATVSQVNIVTARSLSQPVKDWFGEFFDDDVNEKINIVVTGDHDDKERYIRELGLKYFVDDRASTCEQLASGDIIPLVFEQPWNSNQHQLQSVSGWYELRQLLDI